MDNFTPYSALAGGFLIGLSAALLMLFNGRTAGISGIAGALLSPGYTAPGWRLCFLVGLLLGPWLLTRFGWFPVTIDVNASVAVLAVAGLLVGYGTSLGSGCTSGHGICGLARLSLRSLAATLTFMTTAGITVYIVRHVIGTGS
ncbi:MAG: YeeE/YedE family protein [Methylobacter sp.]